MASFSAKAKLESEKQGKFGEFPVLSFKYSAQSPRDIATGQATGRVSGSAIELQIAVAPKTLMALQSLYTNDIMKGEINFDKLDQKSTHLKITFEKASCFFFEQVFHSLDAEAFIVMIKLSVAKLSFESEGVMTQNEFYYNPGPQ